MNSVMIVLEGDLPQTDVGKSVTIQVDGTTTYNGKIILIILHKDIPKESIVTLQGYGLKITP